MLIKRLSKIGLTLLLAVSFIVPVSFDARADFGSTDSTNLNYVKENTANTVTRLGTTNTRLSEIKTELVALNTEVSNIKTAVANTITTTLNQINTKLGNISGYVDGLEGYVDDVETKLQNVYNRLGTINSNLVTAGEYVETISSTETANGSTLTNIYNLLNTNLVNYLGDIRSATLIIKDNVSVRRKNDTAQTITVAGNSSLGNVTYSLSANNEYTFTITNWNINTSYTTKYFNFMGLLSQRLIEIQNLSRVGYNLVTSAVSAFATQVYTDLGYIGTELHLTYQLLDSFKTANHNDITGFNTDFNTYASNWLSWTDLFVILKDNFLVIRVYDDQSHTITLSGIAGRSVNYNTTSIVVPFHTFNNTTKKFETTNTQRWVNFAGMISFRLRALADSFTAYFSYLNDQSPANTIANSVSTLDSTITNLNNAETDLQNRVTSSINNFVPDTNLFGSFIALSWCSTYLQSIFTSLGMYGTVIMVGLLLGVCMQFIGYFRYKY